MANVFDALDTPAANAAPAAQKNVFDALDTPPARVDDPSKVSIGSVASNLLTTANRGVGNLGNAIGYGLKGLARPGFADEPLIPGVDLHDEYNKRFAPQVEQNGPLDRIGSATGQMMADNVVPTFAGAGLIKSGYGALKGPAQWAASTIGQKLSNVAEHILASPGAKPIAGMAGAAEVGAGGGIGKEIAKDTPYEHAAELAGQFALPGSMDLYTRFAPQWMAARALPSLAGKAASMVPESLLPSALRTAEGTPASRATDRLSFANREGQYADPSVPAPTEPNWLTRKQDIGAAERTAKASAAVGENLSGTLARPQTAAALDEANTVKQQIPGFNPDLARATNDPALLKMKGRLDSEAQGDELREGQAAYDKSTQAVRDFKGNIVPKAGEYPQETVTDALSKQTADAQSKIAADTAATKGKLQTLSDSLPEVDPTQGGEYLRATRKKLQQDSNDQTNALRAAIDPGNKSKVIMGYEPQLKKADIAASERDKVFGVPEGKEAAPTERVPITASVNEVLDQRTKALQEIRNINSAKGSTPEDIARRDQLNAQVDKLNDFVDKLQLPDEEMQARFDAFRTHYRDEHIPRFGEGASRDVGKYDQYGYGKNAMNAEDVPGAWFKPNNISEARQANKLYGDDPKFKQTMMDHALDDLRRTQTDKTTGLIKEGGVDKWLAKNERVLNEMPWVREAVSAKNPNELYGQLGQLQAKQRAVADSDLSKVLGKNPRQLDTAMNDWEVMRDIKAKVAGNPEATAALQRAVMDRAPDPFNASALSDWMAGNDKALKQVLTPQHLADLKTVLKAAEIQGRAPRPSGTVEEPSSTFDSIRKATGTSVPTALTTVTSLERGRSNKFWEGARLIGNFLTKNTAREANAVWKEALSNPQVAQQLAAATRAGTATKTMKDRLSAVAAMVLPQEDQSTERLGRLVPQAVQQTKEGLGVQ